MSIKMNTLSSREDSAHTCYLLSKSECLSVGDFFIGKPPPSPRKSR